MLSSTSSTRQSSPPWTTIAPGTSGSAKSSSECEIALSATGVSQLWTSDGTSTGTQLLKSFDPGQSGPWYRTSVDGTLLFGADAGTAGTELWKSDGTAPGTRLVIDIVPGAGTSFPTDLTNLGGTLYFSAFGEAGGRELWRSNGTETGTRMVKDIRPAARDRRPDTWPTSAARCSLSHTTVRPAPSCGRATAPRSARDG